MKKNWIFAFFIVSTFLFGTGCETVTPPLFRETNFNLLIKCYDSQTQNSYSPPTENEEKIIRDALSYLNAPMRESISYIIIFRYRPSYYDERTIGKAGEDFQNPRKAIIRIVNIAPGGKQPEVKITPQIIWHETAHAYETTLTNKNEHLFDEWKKLSEKFYFDKNWKNFNAPRNGILENYGSKNFYEDLATWVQHIYDYLVYIENRKFNPLLHIRDNKKIYRQKLEILRQLDFIGEIEYQTIKKLF